MRNHDYNSIDPETGTLTYRGPVEPMSGDHTHMPSKDASYEVYDERGHLHASASGGTNDRLNITAMNHDVNHRGYYAMEKAERAEVKGGSLIESEKIAYVGDNSGRASAFMVNDTITRPNGDVEQIHLSFQNASYAEQVSWEEIASQKPAYPDAPNPGDDLRASMSEQEYSTLMNELEDTMPNIADDYAPAYSNSFAEIDMGIETADAAQIQAEDATQTIAEVSSDGEMD